LLGPVDVDLSDVHSPSDFSCYFNATAGFDSAITHSSVIDALSDLQRDDSRFWDKEDALRTRRS
jgi:hypothetical protein